MGVAIEESTRRCALPGCDATFEIIPGRPERRYCTAAHRVAARQARRAAAQSGGDARLAEALPWLRPADGPPGPPVSRSAVEPCLRVDGAPRHPMPDGAVPGKGLTRRSRAVAVFGAVGLIVGGYLITASEPARPASGIAAQVAPGYATNDDWAARAQVALASVNQQLDVIAQTEEVWNRVPAAQRSGLPLPVRLLQERKALLERQKTTLQAQLATYHSLELAVEELRRAEERLAVVEKSLRDVPPEALRTPEQAAVIAALEQQRDTLVRHRDAKREALRSLSDGVQGATHTPLPDDGRRTTEVSNEVLALAHDPRGGEGTPNDRSSLHRPEVTAGRDEEEAKPGARVATSGPPDPRGPGHEAGERRANPENRGGGGGPVETVTSTVDDVAAGANEAVGAPAGGSGSAAQGPAERGAAPQAAAPRSGSAPGTAPAGTQAQSPAPGPAAAAPAPAPAPAGAPAQAPSAIAGPAIRTMSGGLAGPYTDAALQQADQEVAARYAASEGAPSGNNRTAPVQYGGNRPAGAGTAE
ncbi:hypothetical protein ACFQE5_14980 [Pseudonocardia hispaniensis]|uniref:Uncharacterized protein n=1 Tax=Pseudonocardia hispaniensis TaxID=904933 RepID=A0ABW1J4I7_9PSEU